MYRARTALMAAVFNQILRFNRGDDHDFGYRLLFYIYICVLLPSFLLLSQPVFYLHLLNHY